MASSLSVLDQLFIALLSIWVCISVASNLFVIAFIWKTSRDRKAAGRRSVTSTDMLIVSLAVNDILLAGIVLPQKIHDISHTEHFHERESLQFLSSSHASKNLIMLTIFFSQCTHAVNQKKNQDIRLLPITSSTVDLFSKLFDRKTQQ